MSRETVRRAITLICFPTSTLMIALQMSSESTTATAATRSLVIEVVAGGEGIRGSADGALSHAQFQCPTNLCRLGDSLIVVDHENHTLRQVTGVLGVADPLSQSDDTNAVGAVALSEFESRAVPLLMTAIPTLPKELARLMAQYARPNGRVTTIAGMPRKSGSADGRALDQAQFNGPNAVAVDTSDAVAGPRLIIGEFKGRRVRCLTLRTQMVTTIAGPSTGDIAHADGPGSAARFMSPYGVTVAPNGTVFVADQGGQSVRRISPAAAVGSERMVTTLIGNPTVTRAERLRFDSQSAECFRQPLSSPWAVAFVPDAAADGKQQTGSDAESGRLYVGCQDGVYAFDLTRGERKHFPAGGQYVTGIAVTEDGARLFAVSQLTVNVIDLRTGACTALVQPRGAGAFLAGPVTDKKETTARFASAMGCVIDRATRSLLISEFHAQTVVRVRGVDV